MTHRNWMVYGTFISALVFGLALTGCAEEEEPVVMAPKPKAAPPPPPKPKVPTIEELMAQLDIDDRIMLSEDQAPQSLEDRKAVLMFFDAFAKGDSNAVRSMVSSVDQPILDVMIEDGQWSEATGDAIYLIEVRTGASPEGDCALALFEMDHGDEPQLWTYEVTGGQYTFSAAPTPPNIQDKLSGVDWITSWHDVMGEELALADEPDDVFAIPQVSLEEESTSTTVQSSGPGVAPSRNLPTGPTRTAPGRGTTPVTPGGR